MYRLIDHRHYLFVKKNLVQGLTKNSCFLPVFPTENGPSDKWYVGGLMLANHYSIFDMSEH